MTTKQKWSWLKSGRLCMMRARSGVQGVVCFAICYLLGTGVPLYRFSCTCMRSPHTMRFSISFSIFFPVLLKSCILLQWTTNLNILIVGLRGFVAGFMSQKGVVFEQFWPVWYLQMALTYAAQDAKDAEDRGQTGRHVEPEIAKESRQNMERKQVWGRESLATWSILRWILKDFFERFWYIRSTL